MSFKFMYLSLWQLFHMLHGQVVMKGPLIPIHFIEILKLSQFLFLLLLRIIHLLYNGDYCRFCRVNKKFEKFQKYLFFLVFLLSFWLSISFSTCFTVNMYLNLVQNHSQLSVTVFLIFAFHEINLFKFLKASFRFNDKSSWVIFHMDGKIFPQP